MRSDVPVATLDGMADTLPLPELRAALDAAERRMAEGDSPELVKELRRLAQLSRASCSAEADAMTNRLLVAGREQGRKGKDLAADLGIALRRVQRARTNATTGTTERERLARSAESAAE